MKTVINVDLYGGKSIFGGKEKPLEADIIYCDKYENCSYYQNGTCLSVRQVFKNRCKFSKVEKIRGYTSRAKKYSSFYREWTSHERYNKLFYPPGGNKLGLIDKYVVFPYPFISIEKTENGDLEVNDPVFSNDIYYLEYEKFNIELIYKICSFKPRALFTGGEIGDFQLKIVPLFLSHLEEVLPDLYKEFLNNYPEFSDKIDYVGRKVYLKTISPSYVYYKSKEYPQFNETWYWDGEYLIYKNGHVNSFSITKDYEIEEIKLRPSDKSIVVVSSNEQVTCKTIFVD